MNIIIYNLAKIFFKWSLIYFLVFIFLEDLKKSFISSHFTPHIILPVIFISGLLMFLFSPSRNTVHIDRKDKMIPQDFIFLSILSFISGVLVINMMGGINFFTITFGLISTISIFLLTYQLFRILND